MRDCVCGNKFSFGYYVIDFFLLLLLILLQNHGTSSQFRIGLKATIKEDLFLSLICYPKTIMMTWFKKFIHTYGQVNLKYNPKDFQQKLPENNLKFF